MPKLSIDGIKFKYDCIDDCKDKIVVIKVPYHFTLIPNINFAKVIQKIMHIFKGYGAKQVMIMKEGVDFETMDTDKAIHMLNDYIDEFSRIKEKLLEDDEDDE